MTGRRDDFEWLIASVTGRGRRGTAGRGRTAERRYETVDEIVERRTRKKEGRSRLLVLLIEMLPFVIAVLLVMLH